MQQFSKQKQLQADYGTRTMESGDHFKNEASLKSQKSRVNMMKKFLILFVAFCGSIVCSFAQDVIVLKSSDEIQALVQDIGTDEVKYKKWTNQSGPTYTLKKSEIFMIKYVNGDKDVFADKVMHETATKTTATNPSVQSQEGLLSIHNLTVKNSSGKKLSSIEVRSTLSSVPEALEYYESSRKNNTAAWIFGGIGIGCDVTAIGFFINALANIDNDEKNKASMLNGYIFLGAGLTCLITEIIFASHRNKNLNSAVETYNNAIYKRNVADVSLKFGVTQSGGLGFIFNF